MERLHSLMPFLRRYEFELWCLAVFSAGSLAVYATLFWQEVHHRPAVGEPHSDISTPSPPNAAAPSSGLAFLPTAILLRDIERIAANAKLELLRFSRGDYRDPKMVGAGEAQLSTLGHQRYELTLKGDYAAVKALLAGLVDRHVQLTVSSLRIERPTQLAVEPEARLVQAQVSLASWFATESP